LKNRVPLNSSPPLPVAHMLLSADVLNVRRRNITVTVWEVRGMQTYNGSGTNNLSGKLRMIGRGSASHASVAPHKRSCEEM
jgi:hypothetical protein